MNYVIIIGIVVAVLAVVVLFVLGKMTTETGD